MYITYNFKTRELVEAEQDFLKPGGLLLRSTNCPNRCTVKIQLPLAHNMQDPLALIYNKDRSLYGTVPVTKELTDLFDDNPKEFFRIHFELDKIIVDKKAKWEHW